MEMPVENRRMNKIIVCGPNGAGKSTFGQYLAKRLGAKFMDIEDYYFLNPAADYPYAYARTTEEVRDLLLADMKRYDNIVLAAVKGDYGDEITSLFTGAVLVDAPTEIRQHRVRKRSFDRFGDRMLPGGDLYERERQFFDMVEQRCGQDTRDWLDAVRIPMIAVDGTKIKEHNAEIVTRWLDSGCRINRESEAFG